MMVMKVIYVWTDGQRNIPPAQWTTWGPCPWPSGLCKWIRSLTGSAGSAPLWSVSPLRTACSPPYTHTHTYTHTHLLYPPVSAVTYIPATPHREEEQERKRERVRYMRARTWRREHTEGIEKKGNRNVREVIRPQGSWGVLSHQEIIIIITLCKYYLWRAYLARA